MPTVNPRHDLDLIRSYLEHYGQPVTGDMLHDAAKLRRFFSELRGLKDIAECDTCGEESLAELPVCPFCGDDEDLKPLARPPRPDVMVPYDEKDLDEAMWRVHARARVGAEQIYEMSRELAYIRDEELWRLRVSENGHSKYSSFYRFCESEMGMRESNTRRLMRVCTEFSLEEFRDFGPTRLSYALRLPEGLRTPVLEATREGTTEDVRDAVVEQQSFIAVQSVKDLPAQPKRDRAGAIIHPKEPSKNRAKAVHPPRDPPQREMTVTLPLGITRVPMWRRPISDDHIGKQTSPASSLAHEPWCSVHLSEDLMLHIRTVRDIQGNAVAFVELRRGEQTPDTWDVPLRPPGR